MGKAGRLDTSLKIYTEMQGFGLRPSATMFVSLIESFVKAGKLETALRSFWTFQKILLEMKAMGYSVDVNASDVLMVYIKDGSVDLALRWLRFMGSSAIRTNNFIIRQLFESCMKSGLYEQAKPLLETYVNSSAKVDLILYTSILAHLVRCQDENKWRGDS
ncbi:hypothetical protein HAX54_051194 [Datura stramonium]|uniref:Pentatricopeptide repeat-containing protein n=1 Tax=Datura stramonium TaxID=4076 RepID=A0ABS8WM65_DATST|nr:hypothetical protein [Datura stramonium]